MENANDREFIRQAGVICEAYNILVDNGLRPPFVLKISKSHLDIKSSWGFTLRDWFQASFPKSVLEEI